MWLFPTPQPLKSLKRQWDRDTGKKPRWLLLPGWTGQRGSGTGRNRTAAFCHETRKRKRATPVGAQRRRKNEGAVGRFYSTIINSLHAFCIELPQGGGGLWNIKAAMLALNQLLTLWDVHTEVPLSVGYTLERGPAGIYFRGLNFSVSRDKPEKRVVP